MALGYFDAMGRVLAGSAPRPAAPAPLRTTLVYSRRSRARGERAVRRQGARLPIGADE